MIQPPKTPQEAMENFRRALNKYEQAVSDLAFKGSQHPDEHALIDARYIRTKGKVLDLYEKAVY